MWSNSFAYRVKKNEEDRDFYATRDSQMMPRYGHPYSNTNEEATDMWGTCLGVIICVSLFVLLAFTMSYPVTYYYYPDDPTFKGHAVRCPNCWM
jgi:hypothetical protein